VGGAVQGTFDELKSDEISTESPSPTVPDGKIQDFVSGMWIKDSEREQTRQTVARELVSEYGFRVEDLAIEFSIKLETGKRRASIAVFQENALHDQNNIIRLMQIEEGKITQSNRTKGVDSLKDMMVACPQCDFGLWTNGTGDRIAFQKVSTRFEYRFEEITDIPGKDQSLDTLIRVQREHLHRGVGLNLLNTFKQCHNYIAANQGIKKDAAFFELLKVIYCKTHDEQQDQETPKFWVGPKERNTPEGQIAIKNRLEDLFEEVKKEHSEIFASNERLELNARVIGYVAAQLQRYSLLDSNIDVKGAAYEEIVGDNLKGDRGQFFTPRNVIRMAVEMLDPGEDTLILDPACGTGGFLIVALHHVMEKIRNEATQSQSNDAGLRVRMRAFAEKSLYGNDFDPDLRRTTQMNMAMNNDGQTHLFSVDALENPSKWPVGLRDIVGRVDVLLTTPPFGANLKIDDPSVLEQYDLARSWDKLDDGRWIKRAGSALRTQPPEVLFIERCYQFLRPGTGRMAIVLPNGILSNPDHGYVRHWILEYCEVLASVSLPIEAFLPMVNIHTTVLFLRRKSDQERLQANLGVKSNYRIFMAVAEAVGKDRRGNVIYKRDEGGNDIVVATRYTEQNQAGQSVNFERSERVVNDDLPEIIQAYSGFRQGRAL